jgi:HEAT repeat protein
MSAKGEATHADTGAPNAVTRDAPFFKRLRDDPMVVADLYARPDDRDVCEPLVRALEDPDALIRHAAVRGLVMLNDLHAASQIFWVASHGSASARKAAVEVLGRIGRHNRLAIDHLIQAQSDPDPSVRECSSEALDRFGIRLDRNPESG